jgi:hypothetical protein
MKWQLSLFALTLFASTGQVITFDSDALGKTPPGWTVSAGGSGVPSRWEVRRDQTARTQPYVLAKISTESAGEYPPMAVLDTLRLRDGDISVRLKPVSGRGDKSGGLVWRYRDANNYYLAEANADENRVRVFKVENGHRIPLLNAAKHEIPSNDWCILKVSAKGTRYQVYIDHRRILQGYDSTFTGQGKVGLWTTADAVTYFDDLRITLK